MEQDIQGQAIAGLTRRQAVRILLAAGAGLTAACTPARILLKYYPEEFDSHPVIAPPDKYAALEIPAPRWG